MARSRCTLHFSHLNQFKAWLDERGIEHRPGAPPYQALRVRICGVWIAIYRRDSATQHFTTYGPMNNLVRAFLQQKRGASNG